MNTFRGMIAALALTFAMTGGAIAIEGCAGVTGIGGAQLAADKGLYLAELAYSGFAQSVIAGKASGILTGARLEQAKAADAKAYDALLKARAGVGSANAVLDVLKAAQGLVPVGAVVPVATLQLPTCAMPQGCITTTPSSGVYTSIDSILSARSRP